MSCISFIQPTTVFNTWCLMDDVIITPYVSYYYCCRRHRAIMDSLVQHTLTLMETTRLKYNLIFINLTWLLGVQMGNIVLRGSHSLKILNIVFLDDWGLELLYTPLYLLRPRYPLLESVGRNDTNVFIGHLCQSMNSTLLWVGHPKWVWYVAMSLRDWGINPCVHW